MTGYLRQPPLLFGLTQQILVMSLPYLLIEVHFGIHGKFSSIIGYRLNSGFARRECLRGVFDEKHVIPV
jgi:hypothetical protein